MKLADNTLRTLKKIQITSLLLCLCSSITVSAKTASTHHKQPAAQLRADCYRVDEDGEKTTGVHQNDLMQIGSLSKIFTSYWALNKWGPQMRLKTKFYILPFDSSSVDIHIAGAFDPYFEIKALQYVVSELNKMGVTKIHELSFDKHFRFYEDPIQRKVAERHYYSDDEPKGATVIEELQKAFRHLKSTYPALVKEAAAHGLTLPKTITMQIDAKNISEVSDVDEAKLKEAKLYVYQSLPLIRLLKEMNRNSNNFAADQFFLGLGGQTEFKTFIEKKLNLGSDQLRFYNGSGDHYETPEIPSENMVYNSATCLAVLKVLHGLRSTLKKADDLKLQDALAVVGTGEHATVDIYENDVTSASVTAKTGTVDPSVALAGLASTKDGMILFASIFGPAATPSERSQGHEGIEQDLLKLIKTNGGPKPLDPKYKEPKYKPATFFVLDEHSSVEAQSSPEQHKALP